MTTLTIESLIKDYEALQAKMAIAKGCLMGIKLALSMDPTFKGSCAYIESVLVKIEED